MAISAFSLARPEMEQMLADSNKKPSGWDWCALDAFDYARLPRPWNDVPYAGVNVRAGLCSDGKGTWELYHKQLTLEEVNQRRLAKQGTGVSSLPDEETAFQPYFSLYNPYTGVLRTFLWVPSSGDLSSKGDALVVRARIVEGKNTVATHLLDYYGDGQMISLNESALPIEKYWILSAPENNLWVILDLFLTYDPTDYNGFDGYEKKLDILYEMKLQNSSTLKLDGALTGELKAEKGKKEPDVKDYLTSGASLVSVTSNGWQSIEEAYDSPKELGGKLKKSILKGTYDFLPEGVKSKLYDFSYLLDENKSAISVMLASVSPISRAYSVINKLFFSRASSSIQYFEGHIDLDGELFDETSSISYRMPYSGSLLSTAPIFAFDKKPVERKLGLFHLYRLPSTIDDYRDSEVEPLDALLVMNPSAKGRVVYGTKHSAMPDTIFGQGQYGWDKAVLWKGAQYSLTFEDKDAQTIYAAEERKLNLLFTVPRSEPINPLTPGIASFMWDRLPTSFVVGAKWLTLNDRVQIMGQSLGAGKALAWDRAMLGVDAWVDELWSRGTAVLRERAGVMNHLVAANLETQNRSSNVIPEQLVDASSVDFPWEMSTSPIFNNNPLHVYPSAELGNGCVLSFMEKLPDQALPTCQTENVRTSRNDYLEYIRSDRLAKTPVWCLVEGSSYEAHLARRALYSNPSCWRAAQYHEITFEEFLARSIGTRMVLAPGYYGSIVVRSGFTLELSGGTYHIGKLQMESGSKLEIGQNAKSTEIYLYDNLIWRAEMGTVDPSRVRMAYVGPYRTLFLETSFFGTVIAPGAKLVMGQHTGCVYYGQYFAKELEVHQGTVIFGTPYKGDTDAPLAAPVLAMLSAAY